MLTAEQIKALLAEGLHIFRGTGRDYRIVFLDPDDNKLTHSHPSDVTNEDWKLVEGDGFDPAEYRLHISGTPYGGHFIPVGPEPGVKTICTKVVKFANPNPPQEGYRVFPFYVVFQLGFVVTDEEACEKAIDVVLLNQPGFTGDNAHPLLVI